MDFKKIYYITPSVPRIDESDLYFGVFYHNVPQLRLTDRDGFITIGEIGGGGGA